MAKRLVGLRGAVALGFLAGCGPQDVMNRLASPREQGQAMAAARALREGHVETLTAASEADLRARLAPYAGTVQPMLAPVHGALQMQSVSVTRMSDGSVTKTFLIGGGAGDHWAMITVVLHGRDQDLRLAGLNVTPFRADPAHLNDFAAGQRGVVGWVWLAAMAVSVVSCLWAVALIWRGRWPGRRWLWTLGSLLGIGRFSLNWATGGWQIQPLYVALLGAQGIKAGPFAPWVFSFGLPVVAWVVIGRRLSAWLLNRRRILQP